MSSRLPNQTLHDAACFRFLRSHSVIVLGGQVLVGQATAILGARVNPQAKAVVSLMGWTPALVVTLLVGLITFASSFLSSIKMWGPLLYTAHTIVIIGSIWHFDPLIACVYFMYSTLGISLVAMSRPVKKEEGDGNA